MVRLLLLNNKRFHFRLMCFVRAHQKSIASTAIKQWPICVALNARTQAHSVLGYQQRMASLLSGFVCGSPLQGEAAGAPVQGQPSVNRSKQGRSTHLSHHHSPDLQRALVPACWRKGPPSEKKPLTDHTEVPACSALPAVPSSLPSPCVVQTPGPWRTPVVPCGSQQKRRSGKWHFDKRTVVNRLGSRRTCWLEAGLRPCTDGLWDCRITVAADR